MSETTGSRAAGRTWCFSGRASVSLLTQGVWAVEGKRSDNSMEHYALLTLTGYLSSESVNPCDTLTMIDY